MALMYDLTSPCGHCPFLVSMKHAFSRNRLEEMASGSFHCHKTGEQREETGVFVPTAKSKACAGALIYLEKRDRPNQLMRIAERLGVYDRTKLNMEADVR